MNRTRIDFLASVVALIWCLSAPLAQTAPAAKGAEPLPGVVIDHSPAPSRKYIGSPSIAILSNGDYLASHDLFGPGSTSDTTVVFGSSDSGASWQRLCELQGQWWSTLFEYRGAVYLIGTSRENGSAVIRRSTDNGRSWTTPTNASSGLLLPDRHYHCAPVPVIIHAGRIWRAMEDTLGPGNWGTHFRPFMLSAPADSDLLAATSWVATNPVAQDRGWLGGKFGGWLEGNAVVTPDGQVVDVLRVDSPDPIEHAAIIKISTDGHKAEFDPTSGFIEFPGGAKKFTIRADPQGGGYWTLANLVPEEMVGFGPARTRNTLALLHSTDLRHWVSRRILLQHADRERHAFQYTD